MGNIKQVFVVCNEACRSELRSGDLQDVADPNSFRELVSWENTCFLDTWLLGCDGSVPISKRQSSQEYPLTFLDCFLKRQEFLCAGLSEYDKANAPAR